MTERRDELRSEAILESQYETADEREIAKSR
jgi:hypothetical protein